MLASIWSCVIPVTQLQMLAALNALRNEWTFAGYVPNHKTEIGVTTMGGALIRIGIGAPLAVNQIPEFIAAVTGEIKGCPPGAIPFLHQRRRACRPLIKIADQIDLPSPEVSRQLKGDPNVLGER